MAMSLKAARINAEKTQEEAGVFVGKSKETIANYEAYTSSPKVDTALKLASFYGVSFEDIIWSK